MHTTLLQKQSKVYNISNEKTNQAILKYFAIGFPLVTMNFSYWSDFVCKEISDELLFYDLFKSLAI